MVSVYTCSVHLNEKGEPYITNDQETFIKHIEDKHHAPFYDWLDKQVKLAESRMRKIDWTENRKKVISKDTTQVTGELPLTI